MQRKIRVLVGKPGLDGHDRGAKVVAAALRDAGMEVIYTGLHQAAEQIVEAALQEDVDVVALSILSGAHMTLFPEVLKLMRERGLGDKLLTGGGIIPAGDMETLHKMNVGRLFGPGSSTQEIAEYIRSWFVEKHGEGSLAPPPPRPDAPAPPPGFTTQADPPAPASKSRPARASSRKKAAVAHRSKPAPSGARSATRGAGRAKDRPARKGAARPRGR
jgi:methylmalonyl-CoA mutase C-terminal domain/subunit